LINLRANVFRANVIEPILRYRSFSGSP
jgi:hypothetical protein